MEVSDQLHAPAALPPRKELPVPIVEEAGSYLTTTLHGVTMQKNSNLRRESFKSRLLPGE
jgi:hypothetical protein